jgi:glutamate synthase (NADPH/NADH) small chain
MRSEVANKTTSRLGHPARWWIFGLGLEGRQARQREGDTSRYQTSNPGVLAAGDMRWRQSLVVWAIREGRQCACAVDEFLMGSSDLAR